MFISWENHCEKKFPALSSAATERAGSMIMLQRKPVWMYNELLVYVLENKLRKLNFFLRELQHRDAMPPRSCHLDFCCGRAAFLIQKNTYTRGFRVKKCGAASDLLDINGAEEPSTALNCIYIMTDWWKISCSVVRDSGTLHYQIFLAIPTADIEYYAASNYRRISDL